MVVIEEILQLPKEEQIAIMHAIQDNLDDFGEEEEEDDEVSEDIIAFVEARIKAHETTHQKVYTWEEVEETLKNRHNIK